MVTNPDGSDAKSTADDHIRLIKAALKRTFPQMDGAVSLSSAQCMYLADVSASVQFQLNTLRDGSATANNAINARFANSASVANNALSLGGVAASTYARQDAKNTFTNASDNMGPLEIANVSPIIGLTETDASANNGKWRIVASSEALYVSAIDDAEASEERALRVERTGTNIDSISLNATSVTINGSTVWHAGNDGSGSGLNADLLDGFHAATAATASTVAVRNSSGYLFAVYFNQSSSESENPNVNSIFVSNGDGYLRKATPAYLGTQLVTKNVSSKSGTAKTISSSAPSGGSDGDIWYQIVS